MTNKRSIIIRAGGENYPVVFANYRRTLQKHTVGASTIAIISNGAVFALHGDVLVRKFLPSGGRIVTLMIGDGEKYKSPGTVNSLYDHFFDIGLERGDVIVAFGGGVVGDTAGFVAATYKRGVNLVQVPTTLLSMVDSSVGGKTGVNHRMGKNLIGTFYQPQTVIINPEWLRTLGRREMVEGLAEIIKAGFLFSAKMLKTAVGIAPAYSTSNNADYLSLIRSAILFKGRVVARDPHDLGLRAILNFGHTFGHAIEKAESYGRYHHGEAVLAGMVGALYLSHISGRLSKAMLRDYLDYLAPFMPHLRPLKKNSDDYVSPMTVDKKSRGGRRVFVLLDKIGQPAVRVVRSQSRIVESVEFMKAYVNNRGKW